MTDTEKLRGDETHMLTDDTVAVELLQWPQHAENIVGDAAAVCYHAKSPRTALEHAMAGGHESVLEHASYTFRIVGISRACLAQLTRHRIASYTVMSQRYVDQTNVRTVIPHSIAENDHLRSMYIRAVEAAKSLYQVMVESYGIPKEDARYILPEGTMTEVYVTMNARELRHFFSLRCCNRAQWEIRRVADQMLALVREASPALFNDAGPGCVRGKCPEVKPCGKPRTDRD